MSEVLPRRRSGVFDDATRSLGNGKDGLRRAGVVGATVGVDAVLALGLPLLPTPTTGGDCDGCCETGGSVIAVNVAESNTVRSFPSRHERQMRSLSQSVAVAFVSGVKH